jgi:NAD(P)-dependent dehydrogenase (short-subunit alcohol dehydrogenase family)
VDRGEHSMRDRVAVVTGANVGIGFETAAAVAARGATTVLACRDRSKGDAAVAAIRRRVGHDGVHLVHLDLADFASVRACADELQSRWDRLDVLVNNAGGWWSQRRLTEQGFEQTFGVNHLGPFLLTQLLLNRLRTSAPSRIVNVSSVGHRFARGMNWDDLQLERGYDSALAYGQSKLANLLFTRELARRLPASEVTANACHPGSVRTGLGRDGDATGIIGLVAFGLLRPFYLSPARGARTTIYLASAPELAGQTGGYYVRRRRHRESSAARDDAAARRLWEVSEQLVAIGSAAD